MNRPLSVIIQWPRITVLFLFLISLLITIPAWAQKRDRKQNIISGEVSAISKNFIAVIYSRDEAKRSENEIALPLSKDFVVEHKRNLSEINVGDLVDLEFEEYTEDTPEGPVTTRVAVVVRFLRSAPKKIEPFTFEPEEGEPAE